MEGTTPQLPPQRKDHKTWQELAVIPQKQNLCIMNAYSAPEALSSSVKTVQRLILALRGAQMVCLNVSKREHCACERLPEGVALRSWDLWLRGFSSWTWG